MIVYYVMEKYYSIDKVVYQFESLYNELTHMSFDLSR